MRSEKNHRTLLSSSSSSEPIPASPVPQEAPSSKMLSFFNFLTLTLVLLGVQFTWTVVLGQGTPYLMHLGMPQADTSLVWIMGPLSGFITHPIVGALSDCSSSKLGRRRPFIVSGVVFCLICFVLLAFCRELGGTSTTSTGYSLSLILAIVMFGSLDFAVNIIQAAARALIMDIAPFAQQERANLWASFMIHLGNIVGYSTGYMNLKGIVGVEKDDNDIRFKILVLLAGITLVATTTVTCLLHKEKVYTPMSSPLGFFSTICNPFLDVFRSVLRLPKNIFFLCIVQFFCWVGWFPLLFYSTTYIGQVYSSQINFSLGKEKEEAERMGNLGSLFMAAVAFAVSTLVYYIQGTRYSLSLPHLWQLGCLLFTILTWVTMVISDVRAALAFNALIGICWAIGTWVPMAILGRILTGGKNVPPQSTKKTKAIDPSPSSTPYLDTEQSACSTASTVPMSVGIVLGIHNVFIVLPQFLSAGISHGIMSKTASEGDFVPGTLRDPTGWVMRVGGICSFIAFLLIFWYTRILKQSGF